MASKKILYVCQEVSPCLPENEESQLCRALPQAMLERGNEIRNFMPRFGCINERRNQLHEVIRLSGMNLVINENDHQLIIKVASIPVSRTQIYFIDNDDYFTRKATLCDADGKLFPDNDERMIFFARGVIETVRKLLWNPDIIHCHGWFATMLPAIVRSAYADDPVFRSARIVASVYDEQFDGMLSPFASKMAEEEVTGPSTSLLDTPTYENLYKFVMPYVDGVIQGSPKVNENVLKEAARLGRKTLAYRSPEENGFFDEYNSFYEGLL